MSKILRRPMFRGGSTNEGIMSVPRRGYQGAGFVNEEDAGNIQVNENITETGTITEPRSGITSIPQQTQTPRQTSGAKSYKAFGVDIEKGSIQDEIYKDYIGRRSDPASKFLINFGLKYMSARPRGGKFGALTTAADAAQKPTEQLYADFDTERLLKLKVMTALSKGEGAGAFEKKINFLDKMEDKREGGRRFTKQQITDAVRKDESERKESSIEQQKRDRSKEIMSSVGGAPSRLVADNMAEFEIEGINKLPKEERAKLDLKGSYFLPSTSIKPKPNTNVFTLKSSDQSLLNNLEVGLNYVDPGTKSVYTYVDKNTFRFVSKY